jgi:sulfotransferase family protein
MEDRRRQTGTMFAEDPEWKMMGSKHSGEQSHEGDVGSPETQSSKTPPDLKQQTGRLPDFLIIGAGKCGTTSLYSYLTSHPCVFMPSGKEPCFFSETDVNKRTLRWYMSLFAECKQDQICGEASTNYTRWPHHDLDSSKLIAEALPNARFIYIMRHPVSRAYSHYQHHVREGLNLSLEEALQENSYYISCGLYMKQINRFLRFFSRERFLFLFLDDLKKRCCETLLQVQRFLDIQECDLDKGPPPAANKGVEELIRTKIGQSFRAAPAGGPILESIPKAWRNRWYDLFSRTPAGKLVEGHYLPPPMEEATREFLLETFREPNTQLAEFLHRDLSHWEK